MIKTGKIDVGKSRCTCGNTVSVIRDGIPSCGCKLCENVTPAFIHKEAREANSKKVD